VYLSNKDYPVTRWIDTQQAAAELHMDVSVLRRIVKSSRNPPPFVRPSERSMLFDVDALHKWQKSWTTNTDAKPEV
jgi:hypothetical protein